MPARVNAEVTAHNVLTLVTAMFLHVGWIHLIGNMWFLFVFGDAVEDAFGWRWFLAIYLLSGFFANIAFMVATSGSSMPGGRRQRRDRRRHGRQPRAVAYGAAEDLHDPAVLCGCFYVVLRGAGRGRHAVDRARRFGHVRACPCSARSSGMRSGASARPGRGSCTLFWSPWSLPAWVVLGLFFLTNLWSGALSVVSPAYGGAVGWWAHIGGFVAGAVLRQAVPQAADRAASKRAVARVGGAQRSTTGRRG